MGTILTSVLVVLVSTTVVAIVVSHRRVMQQVTSLDTAISELGHRQDLLHAQVGQLDREVRQDQQKMGTNVDAALGDTYRSLQKHDQKFSGVAGQLSGQSDRITGLDQRLRALQDELDQVTQVTSAAAAAAGMRAATQREQLGQLTSTVDRLVAQAEQTARQLRASLTAGEARHARHEQQAREFSAALAAFREQASLRRSLAQLDPRADSELQRAAGQSVLLTRQFGFIRDYVHRQLWSSISDPQSAALLLTVTASLEWSGADILWPMLESLCRALGMQVRYAEPASARAGQAYWAWTPAGEGGLDGVLEEAVLGVPDDDSAQPAGVQQLRLTLLALFYGGPGILQVGPLLLASSADRLSVSLLTGSDPDDHGARQPVPDAMDPANLAASLQRSPQRLVADLTDWAAAYAARRTQTAAHPPLV